MKPTISFNKSQAIIGFVILALFGAFTMMKAQANVKLALFLITGLLIGYILQRSRFGFAGGVRRIYLTGDSSLSKALLVLFGVSILGTAAIHFGAAQSGAVLSSLATEGQAVIPGSGFVSTTNMATVIGGLLFGIGMTIGGGCASGTLTDIGEGNVRALIVLFFFCVGGMLGTFSMPWWKESVFFVGEAVYLPNILGYVGTVAVSFAILLGLYVLAKTYESKRRQAGTLNMPEYEAWEEAMPVQEKFNFLSFETYHRFFVERWSFTTGAFLLAAMFIFIISSTGSSWGASGPFTHWGVGLFSLVGVDFANIPQFAGSVGVVESGILNDPVSLRNIAIIIGAFVAMLLTGNFKINANINGKDVAFFAMAGLLMGYGAKIAGGCNVGALYSGIANFSLSGWVFMVALIIGGVLGGKLIKKFNINF